MAEVHLFNRRGSPATFDPLTPDDVQHHAVFGSTRKGMSSSHTVREPQVLNKHVDGIPEGAVYIGRPSKWGNPFVIGKDGDREQVIARFKAWLLTQPKLIEAVKRELKGKDLVCFCAPKHCHGDIYLEIANS